jgi:hypothetical protein
MSALEMDPEIRARWTAALRSGDYEQGYGVLRSGEKYCCLGVLCDLAARDGAVEAAEDEDGTWKYGNERKLLPEAVLTWAGLDDSSPEVRVADWRRPHSPAPAALTTLNDNEESPFAAIADAIDGGES